MTHLGTREQWASEATDLGRAFGGAFLFGIPLLYTMETWWIGEYADLWKLVVFLGLAFLANLGLLYFAGFKRSKTALGPAELLEEAIEAVAVGVVGSIAVLLVLNRIHIDDPLDSVVGKVVIQTVPLSIGASLAGAIFAPGVDRVGEDEVPEFHEWTATLNDLGATVIGSVLVCFAIAPTEEIPMLAADLTVLHVLALVGLSLAVGYVIVFVSDFDPQAYPAVHPGPFQHPITETATAYLISLITAFVVLYLFDQFELKEPFLSMITQVVVLGLPATVGGAAGRLAV